MDINGKFDVDEKPKKVNFFWRIIQRIISLYFLVTTRNKFIKHNCEGLKEPLLLLSTHASMVDFGIAIKANNYKPLSWVCSIEEFNFREKLFRDLGVIYKRKFTKDIGVVKHILYALTVNKVSVAIYPEARFSLIGINEKIDGALGKLAKLAKVPVAVLICHGDFIRSPQYCKHPYKNIGTVTDMYQVVSKEDVLKLSAEEIQKKIEEVFVYDDYQWQYDNNIHIKSKYKLEKIHNVLYQCPNCKEEHMMSSAGNRIWCTKCGATYEADELNRLHCINMETKFTHIPDWYRWERNNVREMVRNGTYHLEDNVRIEDLVSSKSGFVPIGTVHMTHDYNGFTFLGKLDNGEIFNLNKPVSSMPSCHVEYNYLNRGDAIDIATLNNTWFVYPQKLTNHLTKIHFAVEELYEFDTEKKQGLTESK